MSKLDNTAAGTWSSITDVKMVDVNSGETVATWTPSTNDDISIIINQYLENTDPVVDIHRSETVYTTSPRILIAHAPNIDLPIAVLSNLPPLIPDGMFGTKNTNTNCSQYISNKMEID